jgi:GNAT superfamily N-acetyltransferase
LPSDNDVQVTALASDQTAEAAGVLARALHEDPYFVYVLPDPVEREATLPKILGPITRFGQMYGSAVTTAGSIEGTAVWTAPGVDVTPERAGEAGFHEIFEALDADAIQRYGGVMDNLQELPGRELDGPLWYLMAVGVVPGRQRKGVGRALLEPGIERADAEGIACALDTFEERTLPFYASLGFDVAFDGVEPQSGLRVWTLHRETK